MKYYICQEAFAVGLDSGDVWFRAGQRVREDHPVFQPSATDPDGTSAHNRQAKMFLPEDEEPQEGFRRGPGRPRKVEVTA